MIVSSDGALAMITGPLASPISRRTTAFRFFEEGDKVKVTLRFRGREIAHQDIGYRLLSRVKAETATLAKVELEPSMEGRQMVMVLAPR